MENNIDAAVIVGRFQIHKLHDGHLKLIGDVITKHRKVILFLGISKNIGSKKNPLDFLTRKQMILKEYPDLTVLAISDNRDDTIWSNELDYRIKEIVPNNNVVLYGSRDSFIEHYHGKFPTIELEQKVYVSATEIRNNLKNEILNSYEFRAGIIYASLQQRNKVYPTVDIAIFKDNELLLAKKPGENLYRFVGGFVDPTDKNYEDAAKREVIEETGLQIDELKYVTSLKVDDWRFKYENDKIFTILYLANYVYGRPIPNDDICELKWFNFEKIEEYLFILEHKPLFFELKNFLENSKI